MSKWKVQGRVSYSAPLVTWPEGEMDCTWMERMRRCGLLEKWRIDSGGELAEEWVLKLAQSENQINSRGWTQETELGLKTALNRGLTGQSQPIPLCSHWSEFPRQVILPVKNFTRTWVSVAELISLQYNWHKRSGNLRNGTQTLEFDLSFHAGGLPLARMMPGLPWLLPVVLAPLLPSS